MVVTVEQMMSRNSRWMRWRCDRLETKITAAIEDQWSPGAVVFFKVWPYLADAYTVEEMRRRFPDWNIEYWGTRHASRLFMRVTPKEPISLTERPYR